MSVEVIVPYAGDDPDRGRALESIIVSLQYPTVIAHGILDPWCKARTVWAALKRSTADIVILHDADVWCDGLAEAVSAVADGRSWAIPHRHVYRLSKDGTDAYLRRQPWKFKLDQQPYEGMLGGGIIVAQRDVLLRDPDRPQVHWLGTGGRVAWHGALDDRGCAVARHERSHSSLAPAARPPESPVWVGAGLGAPTPVYACEIRS